MLYKKPKDVSYTDMAIYIDDHIYNKEKTFTEIDTIYKYMYFLFYMVACKNRYFNNLEDYDQYAIFSANRLYMRYSDERQDIDIEQQKSKRKITKIKSVLNYIKCVAYGYKGYYQSYAYRQIYEPQYTKVFDGYLYSLNQKQLIQSGYLNGLDEEVSYSISQVPLLAMKIVEATPYKSDAVIKHNLYISCLLSFINGLTLSNSNKKLMAKKIENNSLSDEYIIKVYRKEKEKSTILWHLDESFKDYVTILTNKLRYAFCSDVGITRQSFELSDEILESIMMTVNNKGEYDYYE